MFLIGFVLGSFVVFSINWCVLLEDDLNGVVSLRISSASQTGLQRGIVVVMLNPKGPKWHPNTSLQKV